jgi:hypothetical protein
LIQNSEGLATNILKEKYYLQGSFLEANLGRQPSYVWRSIWNAKRLLGEGLVWRIGNGKKVSIWSDKWAPTSTGGYIQSPIKILDQEAQVSELLDIDTNCWNMNLV